MYKIYFLSALLAIILISCDNSTNSTKVLTAEDPYEIYSLIIDSNFADYDKIVIELITDQYNKTTSDNIITNLKKTMITLTDETFNAYVDQNITKDTLKNNFTVNAAIILAKSEELYNILNSDFGWEKFYQKYPNSQGILSFSKIGYNAANTQALVYYGNVAGNTSGAGYYELFEKVNGKWKSIACVNVWVA